MRATLRTFFRWAVAKDLIVVDPTANIMKIGKPPQRKRRLSDTEIRLFWRACVQIGYPFGPVLQLLLLTGQREMEVGELPWHELNMDEREWMLPGIRAKNGHDHIVPLSGFVLEIIQSLPRNGSAFLFSEDGVAPVSHFQQVKEDLDLIMGKSANSLNLMIEPWIIHDLRRTATTGFAKLKVPPHVADKILNHIEGEIGGVAAVYNVHEYLDERREALEEWARYVKKLVNQIEDQKVELN